jgi:hypothetical protein
MLDKRSQVILDNAAKYVKAMQQSGREPTAIHLYPWHYDAVERSFDVVRRRNDWDNLKFQDFRYMGLPVKKADW